MIVWCKVYTKDSMKSEQKAASVNRINFSSRIDNKPSEEAFLYCVGNGAQYHCGNLSLEIFKIHLDMVLDNLL